MTFQAYTCVDGEHRIGFIPAAECILSWSAQTSVNLDIRVQLADGRRSTWLPYVRKDPRRSCSANDDLVRVEVDVVRSEFAMSAIEIRTLGVDGLFLATPWPKLAISPSARALTRIAIPCALAVPAFSQYVGDEKGWCAAASLAMVMCYWVQYTGEPSYLVDVAGAAAAIYDEAYRGTGNWTFATAYANMRGLRGAVAYLRDLDHAQKFIMAQIPLTLSVAWEEGELDGAPLLRSDGHLLVLTGFDSEGYALVNDPALPHVQGRYRRDQLEAIWQRAGGVCYAIAPRSNSDLLSLLSTAR